MPGSEFSAEDAQQLGRVWWAVLFMGVISIIAGAILVAQPSHSLATLAVVFGIFLLLDGIVELIRAFAGTVESRGLAALVGILGVIVGLVLIRHPTHGVAAVGLLIGIWLVAAGVIRLLRTIALAERSLLTVLLSLLEIVVGIAIVADPHIGYTTLAVLGGLWLIVSGVGTTLLALAIRSAARHIPRETAAADAAG